MGIRIPRGGQWPSWLTTYGPIFRRLKGQKVERHKIEASIKSAGLEDIGTLVSQVKRFRDKEAKQDVYAAIEKKLGSKEHKTLSDEEEEKELVRLWLKQELAKKYSYGIRDLEQLEADQSFRIELARMAVKEFPQKAPELIKFLKISDEVVRVKLARACAKAAPDALAGNILGFKISDEAVRIELARICAKAAPGVLARHIQDFKISDEAVRIELARICAKVAPGALAGNIQHFAISDEAVRIELARVCATAAPGVLAWHIQDFEISKEVVRIELARICAKAEPKALAQKIQNFAISDEAVRVELAMICAKAEPREFAYGIRNFAISDEAARMELARVCAKGDPVALAERIRIFEIKNEKYIRELVMTLAERSPKDLIHYFEFFGATDEAFIETVVMKLAEKDIESALMHFNNFGLKDPSRIFRLKEILARKDPVLAALGMEGNMGLWKDWNINIQKMPPSKMLPLFPTNEPKAFFSRIAKYDVQARIMLFFYACSVSAFLELVPEKDRKVASEWIKKTGLFESVAAYRNPMMRIHLARMLVSCAAAPKARKFYGAPNRRLKIITLCLADLDRLGISSETFNKRCRARGLRDRVRAISECTVALVQETKLTPQEKTHLLDIISSPKLSKDVVRGMEMLTGCLNLGGSDLLKGVTKLSDLDRAFETAFKRVVPVGKVPSFKQKYALLEKHFRDPLALATYAGKLNQVPNNEEYLKLYGEYVENVLEGQWPSVRYELKNNPHLQLVFKENEALETAWIKGASKPLEVEKVKQEEIPYGRILYRKVIRDKHIDPEKFPVIASALQGKKATGGEPLEKLCLQLLDPKSDKMKVLQELRSEAQKLKLLDFENDVKGIIRALQEQSVKRSYKGWTISDTDKADDLLLCGTDVAGSCQSVNGNPETNKNLLAYLMDGKNRLLAIKDFRGKIQARAILRLLWDGKKPVLFMEQIYPDAVKVELKDALNRFALDRAKALGLTLLSGEGTKRYKGTVVSKGGPAPYEYVDAAGGECEKGIFTIDRAFIMRS